MKHAVLTSIAHNIADSLASGFGSMIEVYDMEIFGEAAQSREGFIEVDFLAGNSSGGAPSKKLMRVIKRYSEALPALCERQSADVTDFRRLVAKYFRQSFDVEVTDQRGKTSRHLYTGTPGARPKVLDSFGRARRLRSA